MFGAILAVVVLAQVEVEAVDTAAFPLFASAPYWECVLREGEMYVLLLQCRCCLLWPT